MGMVSLKIVCTATFRWLAAGVRRVTELFSGHPGNFQSELQSEAMKLISISGWGLTLSAQGLGSTEDDFVQREEPVEPPQHPDIITSWSRIGVASGFTFSHVFPLL